MRLVKRYGNRKLYDTSESRYVTLEEIGRWVKAGEEVKILENDSGDDLTAVTFAQIILEEERRKSGLLSLPVLRDIIRHGEAALQNLAATVDRGVEALRSAPERAGRRVQELTQISDRLGQLQRLVDEGFRRSVERVTTLPAVPQHVLGRAAEDHLDDARVAVSADEQEVVAPLAQRLGDALVGKADHRLAAEFEPVGLEVAPGFVEDLGVASRSVAHDVDHGEREPERAGHLGGRVHRGAGTLGAVVGEQRPADVAEPHRRDEDGLRGLACDGLGRAAEHAGRELLVQTAVPDDDEVRGAGGGADLVGDDPHGQRRVAGDVALAAALGEGVEQHAGALLERLAHLGGEV